jgi:hypothetical protein
MDGCVVFRPCFKQSGCWDEQTMRSAREKVVVLDSLLRWVQGRIVDLLGRCGFGVDRPGARMRCVGTYWD